MIKLIYNNKDLCGGILMKIIELTENQFRNYSKMHSARNYFQTVEYAKMLKDNYNEYYLGFINENDNTLMGATLLLEKSILKFKIGYIPGGFLVDYDNDNLFRDFVNTLKDYLKTKKYIYLCTDNLSTYKMFDKNGEVIYFDTNVLKIMEEVNFIRTGKSKIRKVVLETEKTPDETYKMFDSNTRRNINLSLQRAITIYKDESNNMNTLTSLHTNSNFNDVKKILDNFNTENVNSELYFAKIDPEKYINNYRYLLKEEEDENIELNRIMQDPTIKKSISFINKKMKSDNLITKYNNEIIKATNLYTKYPKGIVLGAILIIKNNREIYFMHEGYNKELKSFYTSHLIKWEIIKKYLNLGYKIFNFGLIKNMDKKNHDYLFKMGFGGKVYECIGTYDLVVNKFLYYPIKFLYTVSNKLRK